MQVQVQVQARCRAGARARAGGDRDGRGGGGRGEEAKRSRKNEAGGQTIGELKARRLEQSSRKQKHTSLLAAPLRADLARPDSTHFGRAREYAARTHVAHTLAAMQTRARSAGRAGCAGMQRMAGQGDVPHARTPCTTCWLQCRRCYVVLGARHMCSMAVQGLSRSATQHNLGVIPSYMSEAVVPHPTDACRL